MAIKTRETDGTGVTNKGAPLTNAEVDTNFIELVADKVAKSGDTMSGNLTFSADATINTSNNANINLQASGTGETQVEGMEIRGKSLTTGDADDPLAVSFDGTDLFLEVKPINVLNPSDCAYYPTTGLYPAKTLVIAGNVAGGTAEIDMSGVVADLVGDTTPQLGGNLDLNSNDITGTGDILIGGNIGSTGGEYGDLTFDYSTGTLHLEDDAWLGFGDTPNVPEVVLTANATYPGGNRFQIQNGRYSATLTKVAMTCNPDAQQQLFYNNAKKFETTSTGVQTTGTVSVNGAYTLPTSDGTNGQVLTTDGSGAVTFQDASGGGGGLGEGKALVFANLFG